MLLGILGHTFIVWFENTADAAKQFVNIIGTATLFENGKVKYSPSIRYSSQFKQLELSDVEYITVGEYSFAAQKRDGTVFAWGLPKFGGETGSKQSQLTDVEFIVGGEYAFAAKKRDGI